MYLNKAHFQFFNEKHHFTRLSGTYLAPITAFVILRWCLQNDKTSRPSRRPQTEHLTTNVQHSMVPTLDILCEPPYPCHSESTLGELPSESSCAAAERHRAWVLSLREEFNTRVSRASEASESDGMYEEAPSRRMSRCKRLSRDESSCVGEGSSSDSSGSDGDLANIDEDLAMTLRAALELDEDRLVRAAMGLAVDAAPPTLPAHLPGSGSFKSERVHCPPPRLRRYSFSARCDGPAAATEAAAATAAVREQWTNAPLPPLLHRQSMPDLARFVRQKILA